MEETIEQNKQNQDTKTIDIQPYKHGILNYYSRMDWLILFSIILLITLAAVLYYLNVWNARYSFDITGQIAGLIPLIPVVMILNANRKKQWIHQLPNFLNIDYLLNGKTRLKMELCPLIGLSDTRQQGQSLTRTLYDAPHFPLKPYINRTLPSEIVYDKNKILNNGEPFELHKIEFELAEDFIEDNGFDDTKKKLNIETLSPNQYICSIYPFNPEEIMVKEH